jgi:K+-sensing histidine kinase KdpD
MVQDAEIRVLQAAHDIDLLNSSLGQRADEDRRWLTVGRYVFTLAGVGLASVVGLGLQGFIPTSSLNLLYVLPVIAAAITSGWGPSLTASVAGALAFDFFFIEPRYSLRIDSPRDIWSIILLLAIAATVSALASESRRRALRASRMAAQAEALRALAHAVVIGAPRAQIIERAAMTLSQAFGAPAFILARGVSMAVLASSGRPVALKPSDYAAAEAALDAGTATHAGQYPAEGSRLDLWPVRLPDGETGLVGVDFTRCREGRPDDADGVVEAVAAYFVGSPRP